ncbi:hypothetical protein H4582DRAFT_2097670 [Lactarius indigo]|nr:hypothetical protein H4582DRAFT_2097670 [Lactarius indigo]
MPASLPVDNTLGALFIGTVLSSILYGVTWLQFFSYYNSHCSRDRWSLKSFVAFLMIVDTANLGFVIHETYRVVVTNFGDYKSNALKQPPWSQIAITLSSMVIDVSAQHFYAYRIYRLGGSSAYLPTAISAVSLAAFGFGTGVFLLYSWVAKALSSSSAYSTTALQHVHDLGRFFEEFFIASISCKVLCDLLITVGMVYYLLSNRSQVRRTNNVLNLLVIYSINCGTLHLVFAVSCVALIARSGHTLIYIPPLFIMVRLSFCAFMAILNSRDNLRETLDGPDVIVATFTQLKVHTGNTAPWDAQDTAEAIASKAVPKSRPPLSAPSETSFSVNMVAFDSDRERYPPTVAEAMTV